MELSAGGVHGALLFVRCVVDGWAAVLMDGFAQELLRGPSSQGRIVVQGANDLPAKAPQVVHVLANRLRRKSRGRQMFDERRKQTIRASLGGRSLSSPRNGPVGQIAAIARHIHRC